MVELHLMTAWLSILAGLLSGALTGIFFHNARWLGGYGSWARRMIRLGHIAFFGIGFLNLGYALTIRSLGWPAPPAAVSWTLIADAALMPAVCYLAAWRESLRHLFTIPVLLVVIGVA